MSVPSLSINLPRIVGSRLSALRFAEAIGWDMCGKPVVVNCRELLSSSSAFADELVKQTVVNGGASSLVLVSAYPEFTDYIREAAKAHGVSDAIAIGGTDD